MAGGRVCGQEGCDGGRPAAAPWERAFEEAWPTVERQLRDVLRARYVPAADIEDYLQEVAARALACRVEFHCAADLLPWAATVVRRLHIGAIRRSARQQRVTSLTRRRHTPDAASTVVAKLDLDRLAETLASWSQSDRDMVLGGRGAGVQTGPEAGAGTTSASYARRHRLRAKLLSVIDGLAGVAVNMRRFHQTHAPQLGQLAASMLSPAAIACAALVLPSGGLFHHDRSAGPDPADRVHALRPATPASSSPLAAAHDPRAAVDSTASSRPRGDGAAGHGAASATPAGNRQVHSPVEERVVVDAGERDPYLEIENTEDQKGEYCAWVNGVIAETCVDQPGGKLVSPVPLPF